MGRVFSNPANYRQIHWRAGWQEGRLVDRQHCSVLHAVLVRTGPAEAVRMPLHRCILPAKVTYIEKKENVNN